VLLSNTNAIHFEMILATYPLLKHFDEFVLSYKVGVMKPAERIYREAITAARCDAGECFYADDVEHYVEGAKRAGIDAVRFESCEQIREELTARGIL
jgi:HAD superfamily hydrolase (TIGR01509 family)